MKSLILAATAIIGLAAAPVYGGSADNGGGWRNGERNGLEKHRDYPSETNGFVRQDLRALENEDPNDDVDELGNLANTLEGYATRNAYRGTVGANENVPGGSSQRANGLPDGLGF